MPLTESVNLVLANGEKTPVDKLGIQNVSLLLHGDGSNGSTTITDSSPSPKTVTAFGNAQISTAQSKFGGASIAFDGNGDYLNVAANQALALNGVPFTIELWLYILARPANDGNGTLASTILHKWASDPVGYRIDLNANGTLTWYTQGSAKITSSAIANNTWTHVAICGSGTSTTMYINGTAVNGTPVADVFGDNTGQAFQVGGLNFAQYTYFFNGHIDELRVTKRIARYTANFTPPTAPFPDI